MFIGSQSGASNLTGGSNSFIGSATGQTNTTGSDNTFIGFQSGLLNTVGGSNTFVGVSAGRSNTNATNNTFVGVDAGRVNTTGLRNAAFGSLAGRNNIAGSNNVFLGNEAGRYFANLTSSLTNTTNSIYIGAIARAGSDSTTNEIVIGQNLIGNGSNTATIGTTATIGYFLNGTGHLRLPSGTTAQRPGTPTVGMMRNNTSNNNLDFYTGTAWENI
jgi:trimeric autotransporter adhesin